MYRCSLEAQTGLSSAPRPYRSPPLKDVEPNVQEAIYLQKLQPALRAYLTKLREDAFIDIKEGYTDSGASPNETKPIYMADNSKPENRMTLQKLELEHFASFIHN